MPGPLDGIDPLAGVELVLIDGNNLLHALRRGGGSGGHGGPRGGGSPEAPQPASAIIGRIRSAIPPSVKVELILDGSPSGITGRLATGMSVEYSRRSTADEVILNRLSRQLDEGGPASTWPILAVTDDRALRDGVRSRGGRSAGTAWLLRRLDGTERPIRGRPGSTPAPRPRAGTGLGNGRPSGMRRQARSDRDGC
ncbi:MAG TPA: hypothetical protein VGQ85_02280 [Candidatus Limnocylindrales bacterium]|nr:hypothetical protein [Candidatus Limnocylindrales bacterium]